MSLPGPAARSLLGRVFGRKPAEAAESSFEIEHDGVVHRIRLRRVASARPEDSIQLFIARGSP